MISLVIILDAPMIFFPVIGPFFVAAQETTESKYAVPLILSGLAQSGFLIDYILTSKKIRLLENDNLSYSINPNPIYPSLTFVYNLD